MYIDRRFGVIMTPLSRILKRDNQLHLFRRLEQCSKKQINCDGSIEFLRLCQSFGLTPTFAQVDKERRFKWKLSSETFTKNVISEELKEKIKQSTSLKSEINSIYEEIRQSCTFLRYTCILHTMTNLRKKISRLLYKETDVDEHILNISSYELSFFQKLVLCRGLKFAIPKRVSSIEVKASFEKAYWSLEHHLENDDLKELSAATLRSIALNYIQQKGPKPPKTLLSAIDQLKKRNDIVIKKPDKGTGVVVMDKHEYQRLLSEASVNDKSKFRIVPLERPKTRGRPPKYYHPLLQKEKILESTVRRILPKTIADSVRSKGSRLAHLYGLPKTHKERLAMRPILSATRTYNYALAKWLDTKLKVLSTN
ncbi:hypothetical protein QZH41_003905 [Actinostola sp. cb2023]|nr:hypothetical protein QZH41_003905 [Actinostola sp. cb2023]